MLLKSLLHCHQGVYTLYPVVVTGSPDWGAVIAGTFKHSKGEYSTAIMVLAGLSAFTCILTANFKEPTDIKESNEASRKAHGVAV